MAQYIKKLASGGTADEPELQVRTQYGNYDAERLLANLDNPHNEEVFLNQFTRRKDREHAMAAYTAVKQAVADGSLHQDKDTRWYGNGISDDRFIGYAINFTKQIYNQMTPIKRNTTKEEEEKTKFNADSEFGKYFAQTIFGGDKLTSQMKLDWQQQDDIDPNNKKVRSNTNRLAWLKEYLPKYRDYLNESTTDYDWGIHKNKESYIAKLDKAIQDLSTIGPEYGETEQKTLKSIFNNLGMAGNRKLFDVTNISGESEQSQRLQDIDPQDADDIRFENWLKQPENQQWVGEPRARQVYEAWRQQSLQSTLDQISSQENLQKWNEEQNRIFNSPFYEKTVYTLSDPDYKEIESWTPEEFQKKWNNFNNKYHDILDLTNFEKMFQNSQLLSLRPNLSKEFSQFLYLMVDQFNDQQNDEFTKLNDNEYLINASFDPKTGIITKFNTTKGTLSKVRIDPEQHTKLLEKMREDFYKRNKFKYVPKNQIGGILTNIQKFQKSGQITTKQQTTQKTWNNKDAAQRIAELRGNTLPIEPEKYQYKQSETEKSPFLPFNFIREQNSRSDEVLEAGAQKLTYDDYSRMAEAALGLTGALAMYKYPAAGWALSALSSGTGLGNDLRDPYVSKSEALKYAGLNLGTAFIAGIPILGKKFKDKHLINTATRFAPQLKWLGRYMMASSVPEVVSAGKLLINRAGSLPDLTKDEMVQLLRGLHAVANIGLGLKGEGIRRNNIKSTETTNLNVKDGSGKSGQIQGVDDTLIKNIQSASTIESQNEALRQWAQSHPSQVEGFDPATLEVQKQYMPRTAFTWTRPQRWHFEQSPLETTTTRSWDNFIDDKTFMKEYLKPGGLYEQARAAAERGRMTDIQQENVNRYHKLNPNAPDANEFLNINKGTNVESPKDIIVFQLENGKVIPNYKWVVKTADGKFELVQSLTQPSNAITNKVTNKSQKDAIDKLFKQEIAKQKSLGFSPEHISEQESYFNNFIENLKITRQSKPKTTKSATKPATTETPAAGTPAEPAEGATPTEKQGGKLERLLALKKNGGIVKAQHGTALTITPAPGSWYTRRYPQQILGGFPDQYEKKQYANDVLLNIHNRGNTEEETNNIWNLASPEAFNTAYTSNQDLVGRDLNTYYNNAYNGKSLADYVAGYNKDAAEIRDFWHYGQDQPTNHTANERKIALAHNRLFRQMFANRSATETNDTNRGYNIGYQEGDIEGWMGTSTWKRRMDQYEKEFNELTPEEKKKRVHKIGDLGWVYKKANGDIAILSQEEINNLELENPAQSQTPQPEQTPTPATEGEKPGQQGTTQEGAKQQPQKTGVGSGAISGIPGRSGKWKEWIKNFPDFRPEILDIARLMANLRGNSKMYDLAKQLRTPLKNPMVAHRNVYTGFDIEQAANQQANQLLANAGQAKTSDASINEAIAQEAQYKGQNITREGQLKSDQILRDTAEKQWAVDREVDKYNLGVADFNNAALHELYNQEIKAHMGKIRSNMDSINNYLMANESRLRQRRDDLRDKRERYQDKAEEAWLAHQIANDETVRSARQNWLDVSHRTGVTPAELYQAQYQYQDAQQAATWKYTLEYLKNKGINISHYENNQPRVVKKGGTLDDTQVKKRSKDNDRLIKQIIAGLRENSKALDRLSKAQLLSIRSILK